MPEFVIGRDIATDQDTPVVAVEVTENAPLPKGRHIFQLIVEDDDGLRSDPATIEVVVADERRPTAVLQGPTVVQVGQSFRLDGSQSVDPPPGRVVRYVWTLLR